jgi:Aspartyl/Asparaginyl beta-hydroxylase
MRSPLHSYLYLAVFVIVSKSSEETSPCFYETANIFPELLEHIRFADVLDELHLYEQHQRTNNGWMPFPEPPLVNESGLWTTLPLYGYGSWSKQIGSWSKHSRHFPRLRRALEALEPSLTFASFSRLSTELQPHYGYASTSNNNLRSHLTLILPDEPKSCYLAVEDERHYYKNVGEWMTFDDSKYHWSANRAPPGQDRVVFIVDLARPPWVPRGNSTAPDSEMMYEYVMSQRPDDSTVCSAENNPSDGVDFCR